MIEQQDLHGGYGVPEVDMQLGVQNYTILTLDSSIYL